MGASGSGKSTLIDALANRIAKGSLKGSVKLNGETFNPLINLIERINLNTLALVQLMRK